MALSLLALVTGSVASLALVTSGACPEVSAPASLSNGAVVKCGARIPAAGEPFAGPVLHVIDGRTLCVAQGPAPSQWIRVTLADAPAGNPRSVLMAMAFARRIVCVAKAVDEDGAVATCGLAEAPLKSLIASPGLRAEGVFWR